MDGPELERPSQLSAIDELPTSVKAFYLPFVPGLRVKVVVPPSVEGSSEDVLLATTTLLERGASWPSFAEIEWHRSCTVQGSFVRLMRTYEHVRNFWIWGDGCSVHLDVRELQDVRAIPDGWSVVFTASDPTTLSKLSGEALLQVCEKAKSVDLRSLELERMPSCHSGNYSCQEQRQLNCHLLAPASLRSIGSDASPYFASTSKLDLSHCNELVSIERDSLSQFRGPEVVLPRSIVSLGAGVFSNPSLTHLDLSHCVALTAIPARCFACTEGLTKLLLPNTIEFVGSSAFSECCASIGLSTCEALSCANCDAFSGFRGADLLLPNTIEIIDSSAFSGCCASVDLSACKSLSCIANSAFDDFSGAELRLPASIDTIGHAAFRSCQCAIIDLSACSKLSAIPDHCFAGADHVETVLLPPSIAIIGCSAFEGTERLEELHLPTSCHTVGWKAFSQCGANLDLSACGKLSHIGGHAFGGFRGDALRLPASTTIETIEWTTYSECCASVDLSTWEGLSCVGPSAFADFRGANLLLPNTIEIIDNNAFSGCSASVDLTACDALSCIGANVFEGFRGAELRLPNTIVRIEQQAFSRCKASVDLSACESLSSIGDSAFEDFSGAELRLPASIDTLGVAAFKACQCSAIDLSQCSKLTAIPDRCFMKCGSMVRLPPGVSSVGKFAFAGCTTSVDLSACHDVSELREGTFSDFAGPELRLPAIDKIGDDAFSGFQRRGRSLPSDKSDFTLDLSSWTNVTEIPHHCFANGNFARILLPTTITTVGVEAFSHCSASVDFTVCSISDVGEGAFSGYKGSTVDLSHCTGLEKIPFKCFNGAVCDAILLPPGVKTIEWCACIDCTPAVDLSLCSLNTNHGFDRKPDDGSHTAFDFFNR